MARNGKNPSMAAIIGGLLADGQEHTKADIFGLFPDADAAKKNSISVGLCLLGKRGGLVRVKHGFYRGVGVGAAPVVATTIPDVAVETPVTEAPAPAAVETPKKRSHKKKIAVASDATPKKRSHKKKIATA